MQTIQRTGDFNIQLLAYELETAVPGIISDKPLLEYTGTQPNVDLAVIFPDAINPVDVTAVLDAHDPSGIDPVAQQENEDLLALQDVGRDKVAIVAINVDIATIDSGATNTELQAILRRVLVTQRKIAKALAIVVER
ncbi:MAG: hypothetical protein D6737_19480 [Chloroflexi bacterium]|nr:MAG: hypothetical protein CUN54_07370 [Phototrophicales bacterium]RMF76785.1 MAG: hypothetical protein D6737_19480 [Chloroflexota bacterium]